MRPFFHKASPWLAPAGPLILLACLGLAAWACSRDDDAAAIGKLIEKGARLAEEKQIGDLLDLTDEGFIAMPGHYDTAAVKGIVFRAFMHYGRFRIYYPQPAVEVDADTRTASATVYFIIVRKDQDLPDLKELYSDPRRWLESAREKADLYQLKLQLNMNHDRWRIHQAQLEGFKGTGF